jgi:hypothetical protein
VIFNYPPSFESCYIRKAFLPGIARFYKKDKKRGLSGDLGRMNVYLDTNIFLIFVEGKSL